eukprot:1181620-Prorocentrum_minimum.AAC.2
MQGVAIVVQSIEQHFDTNTHEHTHKHAHEHVHTGPRLSRSTCTRKHSSMHALTVDTLHVDTRRWGQVLGALPTIMDDDHLYATLATLWHQKSIKLTKKHAKVLYLPLSLWSARRALVPYHLCSGGLQSAP